MKKSAVMLSTILLCLALVFTALGLPSATTAADEIKIYPVESSAYASYDGAIVYTKENSLVLATENGSYTLPDAYEGACRSLAITDGYVFMLSASNTENGEKIFFNAYAYSAENLRIDAAVNALRLFGVSEDEIQSNKYWVNETIIGGNKMGGYDLLYVDGDTIYCMASASQRYPEGTTGNDALFYGTLGENGWTWTSNFYTNLDLALASDFAVIGNQIVYVSEGGLYASEKAQYASASLKLGDLGARSVAYADGVIYLSASDGIYAVDPSGYSFKKLTLDSFDGMIRILRGNDATYLLAHDKNGKCVKQYVCDGTSYSDAALTYFNIFDGVVYQDPTEFSLLRVGKTTTETEAYFSPKNLKVEYIAGEGEYVLALAEQDGFYYVRNDEGKTAYIRKSNLALLEASTDTAIGKYAQVLHENTNIYLYPYISDDIVATIGSDVMLIVVDNVAQDGGSHVWGWYKVCIVGEDGNLTFGYLQKEYASRYTNFDLPSFSADATVSANSLGGIINVYLLPDNGSEVLGTLTDGDKITLAQDKLDESQEWTRIVYKEMVGYVRTENLISEGITPLQITLIVVFSVVIVATAIVIVLVVKKRNAQKFDY